MIRKPTYEELEKKLKALEKKEKYYNFIIHHSKDAILVIQGEHVIFANKTVAENTGYTLKEITSFKFTDFIYKEDISAVMEHHINRLNGLPTPETYVFRLQLKNKEIKKVEIKAEVFIWKGKPATLVYLKDINEIEKSITEEKTEKRFKELAELLPESVYETDAKGQFTFVNDYGLEMFGYTKEDNVIQKLTIFDVVSPKSRALVKERFAHYIMTQTKLPSNEYLGIRKDGTEFPFLVYPSLIMKDGLFQGIRGVLVDISSRKTVEIALAESEEKFRLLSEQSLLTILILQEEQVKYVNHAILELSGYRAEELLHSIDKTFINLIHVQDKEYIQELLQKKQVGIKNLPNNFSFRLMTKSGKIKWVEAYSKTIFYQGKTAFLLTILDVTEKKLAEAALHENEKKYRTLFDSAVDGILILSNHIIIDCNNKVVSFFETTKEHLLNTSFFDLPASPHISAFNPNELQQQIGKIIFSTKKPHTIFWQYTSLMGKVFDVELKFLQINISNVSYLFVLIRDITEKNRIERALHENERNYRNLVENSPHGILIHDEKEIYFANTKAIQLFGYESLKDLEKNFDLASTLPYLQENAVDASHFMGFKPVKHTLNINHQMVEVECQTDTFIYNDKSVFQTLIKDLSYEEKLIKEQLRAQIAEDSNIRLQQEMQERIQAENKLKELLQEKEILFKEVHHRVKNNMQIISSILNLQASQIEDKAIKNLFRESQDRIKSMALVHENLYGTDDLSKIDFEKYLKNLVGNLFRSYTVNTNLISFDLQSERIFLSLDIGIPCGLIINELISNSIKYAFDYTTKGCIFVKFIKIDSKKVSLIVGDDGKGLGDNFDLNSTTSLGLEVVNALVDQIDGTIDIDKTVKGTKFIITFSI